MKTRVFAVAFIGAMAAMSASATDVQMYGVLDYGMSIQHRSYVDQPSTTKTAMMSGQYIGSRFGIKGTEELANGVKVGFVLENGFSADTGKMGQGDRLFGRDARLFVEGAFGHVSFGRMGSMVGGNGPFARFGHVVSPFSCGWGDVGGTLQVVSLGYEFIDNAIAYTTPKFGGFDATVQYSFGTDSTKYGSGTEGKSSVGRMYSATIRYQNERMMVAAGIENINQTQPAARQNDLDDSFSFNLGGNYNVGWAKFYGYGQYFQNYAATSKTTMFTIPSGIDGYGMIFGVDFPLLGGNFKASAGYGDFKGSHEKDLKMKTYQVAAGYTYPLSKRTTLYTAADWIRSDYSDAYEANHPKATEGVYELIFGIVHKF